MFPGTDVVRELSKHLMLLPIISNDTFQNRDILNIFFNVNVLVYTIHNILTDTSKISFYTDKVIIPILELC